MNESDKIELIKSIRGEGMLSCQNKEMHFIRKASSMFMDIDSVIDFGMDIGLSYNAMNHYINQVMGTNSLRY